MRPAHDDPRIHPPAAEQPCRGVCRHLANETIVERLPYAQNLVRTLAGRGVHATPVTVEVGLVVACPVRARAIAVAYRDGPDWDDAALPAYRAFRAETARQFDLLTRPARRGGLGIDVIRCAVDPYPDSAAMAADVIAAHRLRVYATGGRGNDHPLLSRDENDMFRAVHDAFGHMAARRGFDRHGEDAAWLQHARMYSPLARAAMTTETRGQSSAFIWQYEGRRFPAQKVMLLPAHFRDPAQVAGQSTATTITLSRTDRDSGADLGGLSTTPYEGA